MSLKNILFTIMIVVLAIVVFVAWTAWNAGQLGWAHVVGLGASVLLLIVIGFWPGNRQPTQPPN
jgi:membrane associated rhomboid family serine protease